MSDSEDDRVEVFDFRNARRALLEWYAVSGRVFPWRSEPTPYRVWISEIMLQQTTTQTALGYFERFLSRFPDPKTLAEATEEETLKYWEGLGYYRRAKMLRAAAQIVAERFDGRFPDSYDDVLALPGIGRYAAGAILSFGFDKRFPILEANTTRLHARLTALREETTRASSQRLLWKFAEDWLPEESSTRKPDLYRKLNAALTDLGRLVCAPAEPACEKCPIAKFCRSRELGLQNELPVLKKKSDPIRRVDVAMWISRSDLERALKVKESQEFNSKSAASPTDVLLARRPQDALWAGLWDFPRFSVAEEYAESDELRFDEALAEKLQYFLEEESGAPGKDYRPDRVLATVRHSVTKYRVTLRVARLVGSQEPRGVKRERTLLDECGLTRETKGNPRTKTLSESRDLAASTASQGLKQAEELRWVPIEDLKLYPLTSPARKIAQFIEKTAKRL